MARQKNYNEKLENLQNEILATEQKLRSLYDERENLEKERDMNEIANIYKTMRENNVTVEQLFASVQKPKRQYNKKSKNNNVAEA